VEAAAQKLGLPASYTEETELPFKVRAAVRFDNQAQFHPRKYLLALAEKIPGGGSHVFEGTRATDVEDGDTCVVKTPRGAVRAKAVVVSTHLAVGHRHEPVLRVELGHAARPSLTVHARRQIEAEHQEPVARDSPATL
jgi:glycine/D-amino acid oxidase-like deaminating enzyme